MAELTDVAGGNLPGPGLPAITAILGRHSVREGFTDEPIPSSILEKIVECGLAAPSSKNAQPWRFHVITSKPVLEAIAGDVVSIDWPDDYVPHDPLTGDPWPYESTVRLSAQVLHDCTAAIFVENRGVFSRGRGTMAAVPEANRLGALVGYGFEMMGLGAAVENMAVAAHALGVASCFMGDVVIAEPEIKARLSVEGDLVGVLALGYSTQLGSGRPRPGIHDPDRAVWH